jgi:hypothetical protein
MLEEPIGLGMEPCGCGGAPGLEGYVISSSVTGK